MAKQREMSNTMSFHIYNNKKVFLTGHTGFKGSWLYLWLQILGAKVYGYSLPPSTSPSHFELLKDNGSELQGEFADIRDRVALQKALKAFEPDIIFHLAAQPLVRQSYKDPSTTFETNAIGTLNILECARGLQNLKAIVAITTDKVYANQEWVWGYRENDPLGGYDPYSASKACAEIIIDSMRNSFFNPDDFNKTHNVLIASARAGNVIGGGDFSTDRIIPDLIKGVIKDVPTEIRSPYATRPWQNVLEPLRGYLHLGAKLLEGIRSFAGSFNFGPNNNGNLQVIQMLQLAKAHWDKISYDIKEDSSHPHEANRLMLDVSKAYHLLSWQPILTPEQSIQSAIAWYKAFVEQRTIITKEQLLAYIQISNGGGDININSY